MKEPGAPAGVEHRAGLPGTLFVSFAAALVSAFLFLGPGLDYHPIGGHELMHFGYLNEISHGNLVNIDTRFVYGPLLAWSIHGFMSLTSFSVLGFRVYWNCAAALTLTLLMVLLYRRLRHPWLLLPAFLYLALWTTARFYLPGPDGIQGGHWGWANVLRHGWVTILLLAAGPGLCRLEPGHWFAAGVVLVSGTFYAQETGGPALAALVVAFLAASIRQSRRRAFRGLFAFLFGSVSAFVIAMIPAMIRGAPGTFLAATFHGPGLLIAGGGNLKYPAFVENGSLWPGVAFHAVPMLLLFLLASEWRNRLNGRKGAGYELPLAVYGALSYVTVLVRADMSHLLNVMVAPVVSGILALDGWFGTKGPNSVRDGVAAQKGASESPRTGRSPVAGQSLVAMGLLLLPLLAPDGLPHLVRGIVGRMAHWNPDPPPGWVRLDEPRAQVWVPAGNWYDSGMTLKRDSLTGMRMIRDLARGEPVFIVGRKASLHYFLSYTPCSVPFTDLSTTCWTAGDRALLDSHLDRNPPPYIFVAEEYASEDHARGQGGRGYRSLGLHHGFFVFQRLDVPDPFPADYGS